MSRIEFDYYYGAESEQFSFVRVPRVLFTDEEHFGNLSSDAKILYGLLLDRMCLSRRNNWIDEENRVFIIFPIDEIVEQMGVCCEKAVNILKELDEDHGIGLVKKKRRGLGLPSILYVKNFIINSDEKNVSETIDNSNEPQETNNNDDVTNGQDNEIPEFGKTEFKKSEIPNSRSRKNRIQEFGKTEASYTKENYTDLSYTQSIDRSRAGLQNFSPGDDGTIDGIDRNAVEEAVKKQIDYECIASHPDESVAKMGEEIKDLIVDVLCGERKVVVSGKIISDESAKAAYKKITFEHVWYVLESVVNYSGKISRIDRFLTTSLFNSVYTLTNSTFAGIEHDMGIKML